MFSVRLVGIDSLIVGQKFEVAVAKKTVTLDDFEGFSSKGLNFLRDLKKNNEREWFQARRDVYETELKLPVAKLIVAVAEELAANKLKLTGDPKTSLFRLNRDVRFSRDKSPYKTHLGIVFSPDGRKNSNGLLYIHIDPAKSFWATGFYYPEQQALDALRQRIATKPQQIRETLKKLAKCGLELSEDSSALKRLPRGFEKVEDEDIQELVKQKSYIVVRDMDKSCLKKPDELIEGTIQFAKDSYSLLEFGWSALAPKPKQKRPDFEWD